MDPELRVPTALFLQLGAMLILACLAASCVSPGETEVALRADQMEGFVLVKEGSGVWQLETRSIECPAQTWKHTAIGMILDIRWVLLHSPDQARASSRTAGMWLAVNWDAGSYSDQTLGDMCWFPPDLTGERSFAGIAFCRGRFGVAVIGHVKEGHVDTLLVEEVARRLLQNIDGAGQ